MAMSLLFSFFIFLGIYTFHFSKAKEPLCSKFSYEEQLLEKMIRTEIKVEMMVNEIKTTQDNVLSTLWDIKQTVAEFSDRFVSLNANVSKDLIKKGDEIKKELFEEARKNLEEELQGKLERPAIAFYAHHLKDVALDKKDKVIIFDNTFINEKAGYDTSTGIFTAPIGGLYQFIVHTCASKNKHGVVGLVLEGKLIAAGANYESNTPTCSTVGAVVRVRSGEKVWVKATWHSSSNHRLYQDTLRMNTFSGILFNI